MSQGIVHGEHVTCPLHGWVIGLRDGMAAAPDSGCAVRYEVRVVDGEVWVDLTQAARSMAAVARLAGTTVSACVIPAAVHPSKPH